MAQIGPPTDRASGLDLAVPSTFRVDSESEIRSAKEEKDEVEERWGKDAYAAGDAWWRGKSPEQKRVFQELAAELSEAWTAAAAQGLAPGSERAQVSESLILGQVIEVAADPGDIAVGGVAHHIAGISGDAAAEVVVEPVEGEHFGCLRNPFHHCC